MATYTMKTRPYGSFEQATVREGLSIEQVVATFYSQRQFDRAMEAVNRKGFSNYVDASDTEVELIRED